jgi:hypothetical protein
VVRIQLLNPRHGTAVTNLHYQTRRSPDTLPEDVLRFLTVLSVLCLILGSLLPCCAWLCHRFLTSIFFDNEVSGLGWVVRLGNLILRFFGLGWSLTSSLFMVRTYGAKNGRKV